MSLTDSEVARQIKHMMAFIEQEAIEKAEEIEAKAEEEFNIEKCLLVQQQRVKIMEYYERKGKQVELNKKIQNSNMLNQARLQLLKAREEHMMALLDECRQRLISVSQNRESYLEILTGLITQGLFQLMEPVVKVRCRAQDVDVVKDALTSCVETYKSVIMGKKGVSVKVDEQHFLPTCVPGGVELYNRSEVIKVTNTLESRMDIIFHQMLPELRDILFGHNPNRRFKD